MTHSITKTITVLSFLMIPAFVAGQGIAKETEAIIHMPSFSELEEGWNTMKPGGETSCAHGTEFEFYVHPGNPDRLMIFLYGGGACWNSDTCNPDRERPVYAQILRAHHNPANRDPSFGRTFGIMDTSHPENPFHGQTKVAVPYCTGDLYLGKRDEVYRLAGDNGTDQEFTIRHRGITNMQAVLNWVFENIREPETIFVGGTSAGGIAVPYYSNLVAIHYPDVPVKSVADDVASYRRYEMKGIDHTRWGVPETLAGKDDRWAGLWEHGFDMPDLFIRSAMNMPNLSLYQVDHANDQTQKFYIELLGNRYPDVASLIQYNRNAIQSVVPEFRGFTSGGIEHGILRTALFYRQHTDDIRIRDWIASIAAGVEVDDVQCSECRRAGFIYGELDLEIIDISIKLLSAPDSWNPIHEAGPCPQNAEQFSLLCAVVEGVRNRSDDPPLFHPAVWDVIYTSLELQDHDPTWTAPVSFNNRPDATREEMVELLKKVRKRILERLAENP